jgi:hypothetical protein
VLFVLRLVVAVGVEGELADAVAYGPGPTTVMHAPEEHVPISNLVEACDVYASVLGDSLGYGRESRANSRPPTRTTSVWPVTAGRRKELSVAK